MARRTHISRRFTSGAVLNEWRIAHELYVRELASLFGMPIATVKDKLYDRAPMTMRVDRAIANIEYLIALGAPPEGWPERLRYRLIRATSFEYIEPQSAETPDQSPTELR